MEEVGLRMHKYSDRWVSCRGGTEEPVKDESSRPIRADVLVGDRSHADSDVGIADTDSS